MHWVLYVAEIVRALSSIDSPGLQTDSELVDQLRSDLEGLMSELADLSSQNDELMAAKDSDHALIQNLDGQVKEYKKKYETAKTELRGLKGT